MNALNQELGIHRGREDKTECSLCRYERDNVSHALLVFSIMVPELVL